MTIKVSELNRKSQIVLSTILKNNYTGSSKNLLPLVQKRKIYGKRFTLEKLDKTLGFLERMNLVTCAYADNSIYYLELTYEGEEYLEFGWVEIKSFLLKSIFTPIAVSFVTALITALIVR